jgi:pilus assembly protein CpaD
VIVGYMRFHAKGPDCGRGWDDITANHANRPYANFGCATTANMAAQIANPADVVAPHAADPADAGRRQTVLDHYRKGELTSSVHDDQANGAVSRVVP